MMKKRMQLPKLRISYKNSGPVLTPISTKRSNTPQTLSPYSAQSLKGEQTHTQVRKKSQFSITRTVKRKSTQLVVKEQTKSPRKLSELSTVTTIPVEDTQQEQKKRENEEEFELKYSIIQNLNHPELQFLFKENEKQKEKYHLQGDIAFYAKDIQQKRDQIKQSQQIIERINKFISNCFQLQENQTLSKQHYFQSFFRISCILRPELYKTSKFEEIRKILESDWVHDSKGKKLCFMEKNDLFDSLWELVDTWTPEVDETMYMAFLGTLEMKFVLPILELGENSQKRISIYDIM